MRSINETMFHLNMQLRSCTILGVLNELFSLKKSDERLVTEMNKVYAIGYRLFTIGLLLDVYYNAMRYIAARSLDMSLRFFDFVSPIEIVILLLVGTVCTTIATKKGLTVPSRVAENSDSFPWKYYGVCSLLWGIGAGVAATLCAALADFQILGVHRILSSWNIGLGIALAIAITLCLLLCSYLTFKIAKRQEDKQLKHMENHSYDIPL